LHWVYHNSIARLKQIHRLGDGAHFNHLAGELVTQHQGALACLRAQWAQAIVIRDV
jgi:hypothetical protein